MNLSSLLYINCVPQARVMEEGVEGGAAGLLGRQLDILTKELEHLQCEQREGACTCDVDGASASST